MLARSRSTITVRIDEDLPVVDIGARSGLLWAREGALLAGIGEAARLRIDRPGGFAAAAASLADFEGPDGSAEHRELAFAGTGPVAFGALPFDPDEPGELIVPRLVVGANPAGMRWITVVGDPEAPASSPAGSVSRDTLVGAALGEVEALLAEPNRDPEPVEYALRSRLSPEVWRDEVVGGARDRITRGDLEKAVLAREMILATDTPIAARAVMARLEAVFPSAALFLVDGFLGASPELLVSRIDDVVRAHPLAGTAARSTDPVVDQRQIATLLGSEKDRWEHRITIDWLLDTLLPFCSYVDAEPEPSIVTLANVHHLGTRVEGRLSLPAAPILELVAALHPTPAVGGSPQKQALIVIGEIERAERGRYAGPVGWVDSAGNGEFAVGVRSAELDGRQVRFFAGVGVVGDSDPQAELEETRAKFKAMLGALIVP